MSTAAPQPGSAPAPTAGDSSPPSTPLSWEGDRMFNIYIYDYCYKRGFRKTARELLAEAEIPLESTPPINARQGLLFEWWSVFWVLFTAKSNGSGTDEAMLYTQHQAQLAAQRQAQQRMQSQGSMPRFMNGVPRQPGLMNGVGSAQGQMQPSFPTAPPGQQPNGIPGSVPTSSVPGAPPQPPFQSLLPGRGPPPLGPQQRVPNGMPPFQSPTMAHSPTGGAPQHGQSSMGQLGPSPHLAHMNRGGMLPPNTMQGMNNQGAQGNTPTQTFQQIGRPPSPPTTPGHNNMMTQPSPSLAARQAPGGGQPGGDVRQAQEASISGELLRLNPALLASCKQDAGLGDKDFQSCSLEEKQRILGASKARASRNVKPAPPGSTNATAGPSGSNPNMQSLPLTQRNQQPPRGNKRNSTSPEEEHDLAPKLEASPPDRKRVRRSPLGMEQSSMPMSYPHSSQQGAPGGPQQVLNGMMRGSLGGQPMGGNFPHPPGMPNMGNMPGQMGVSQMGNAMSPGMSHPGPGGMMGAQMTPQVSQQQYQMRETHYRQSLHAMHKNIPPGVMNSGLPNSGSPSSSDPLFNPNGPQGQGPQFSAGPNSRMPPNKPMGMMPPPSPVMNPAAKDHPGANKDNKSGHPEGSPRNAPNAGQPGQGGVNSGNSGQGGTAPPTPVPVPNNQNMPAPSPSAILSNPPSVNTPSNPAAAAADSITQNLFSNDFIQSVASSLDEFDPSMFRGDGDINFERDFGQWFNPDDVGTLDLK